MQEIKKDILNSMIMEIHRKAAEDIMKRVNAMNDKEENKDDRVNKDPKDEEDQGMDPENEEDQA